MTVPIAAVLMIAGIVSSASAAGAGSLVQASFRGCQVVRLVYRGYPADTVLDWAVTQFGQPVDRGAFVSGDAPPGVQQVVTLRLRRPLSPGTDALFILDGDFSVRRKPRCGPTGEAVAPGVRPGTNGSDQRDLTVADDAVPITRGGIPAAIVIVVLSLGLTWIALVRRRRAPRPARRSEKPLPPWLHTPVPTKRSWFRKQ